MDEDFVVFKDGDDEIPLVPKYERDEARRVARRFYREAQEWKHIPREDTDILYRFIDDAERWSAIWKRATKKWYREAKEWEQLYQDGSDYNEAHEDYQHSLESALHNTRQRAEAAEQRVQELERINQQLLEATKMLLVFVKTFDMGGDLYMDNYPAVNTAKAAIRAAEGGE